MNARERTWLEVDLTRMRRYESWCRDIIGEGVKLIAVVKANAYGLGAARVGRELLEGGADILATACLDEALELRRALPDAALFVMGYVPLADYGLAARERVTCAIWSEEQARKAAEHGLRVQIKLDTGFRRLGFDVCIPEAMAETVDAITRICALDGLHMDGVFSHLALVNAKEDAQQVERFDECIALLESRGVHIPMKHIGDSIGMVRYPHLHYDAVRVGAYMYGVWPSGYKVPDYTDDEDSDAPYPPLPVMAFKTRIVQLKRLRQGEGAGYDFLFRAKRETTLATLCAGYSDGYPRCMTNRAFVSIKGQLAPVVGLVCMDQMMIDVTDIEDACEGDEVTLLGGPIPLLDYANWANTNRNEAISIISRRVPRIYMKDGADVETLSYMGNDYAE